MRYVPPSERRNAVDWSAVAAQQPEAASNASNLASRVVSYLIAGPVAYAGLGWLADHFLGTTVFTGIGALCGFGLSMYLVWLRYGKDASQHRSVTVTPAGPSFRSGAGRASSPSSARASDPAPVDTRLDRTPSEEIS